MKNRSYLLAAAIVAMSIAPSAQAASEEPFWQQTRLAGGEKSAIRPLRLDATPRAAWVGRAAAKGRADQDAGGLVMQWTRNVWVSATGGFNEEGTAMSGHVKLHLDF